MGTDVAYMGMHIRTVRRGCAGSELLLSMHLSTLWPHWVLWVSFWVARHRLQSWAQPQAAWAQPHAAACPTVGQEAGEYLSLAGG